MPGLIYHGLSDPGLRDPAATAVTRFAAAMQGLGPYEPRPHLAVAVSGGSDSLALLLLLVAWSRSCGGRLSVLSVNHGLRPEAAAECQQVGAMIADLNQLTASEPIEHVILTWQGHKPASGLMAAARTARYELMAAWCRTQDVLHLAVGHHADDQAETVLMRQDHGSSVFGLAGMAGSRHLDGVRLIRPLLGWRKAELRGLVAVAGIAWIEDPSNAADHFERVRWRQQLADQDGADHDKVLTLARAAGRERDHLERLAADWFAAHARINPAGTMALDLPALTDLEPKLALHILRQGILLVGGGDFAPSPAALARLLAGCGEQNLTLTLGGCLIIAQNAVLTIYREAAACGPAIALDTTLVAQSRPIWDRRFVVDVPEPAEAAGESGSTIAAVGEQGLANRTLPAALAGQPSQLRATLPGIWRDGRLSAIAGVNFSAQLAAGVEIDSGGGIFYNPCVSFHPTQPATSCGFDSCSAARTHYVIETETGFLAKAP